MLIVTGLNHESAPESIRERGAFIKRTALETLESLSSLEEIKEALILSTCNRSEIFVYTDSPERAEEILRETFEHKDSELKNYLYTYSGEAALEHLYRLACGLDSMVIGEDQILGQLKEALTLAGLGKYSGKFINTFFREAITFSKRVRTEYKISEVPRSLPATAVKWIVKHLDNYKDLRILIVGSGKMGVLALKHLSAEGFENITMTNRTYHPGDEYREIFTPLNIIKYHDRYEKLEDFDVIISATSSPHVIFRREEMPKISHEQLFIDLALPMDIDRSIGELDNTKVIGIDDFKKIIDQRKDIQEKNIEIIESEISTAVEEMMDWEKHTGVDEIIGELNASQRKQADETIEILNKRYKFSGKDKKYLQKIIRAGFSNLVKPTLLKLKQIESDAEIETIKKAVEIIESKEIVRKNEGNGSPGV